MKTIAGLTALLACLASQAAYPEEPKAGSVDVALDQKASNIRKIKISTRPKETLAGILRVSSDPKLVRYMEQDLQRLCLRFPQVRALRFLPETGLITIKVDFKDGLAQQQQIEIQKSVMTALRSHLFIQEVDYNHLIGIDDPIPPPGYVIGDILIHLKESAEAEVCEATVAVSNESTGDATRVVIEARAGDAFLGSHAFPLLAQQKLLTTFYFFPEDLKGGKEITFQIVSCAPKDTNEANDRMTMALETKP